jgi:hypothetical protein
MKRKAIGLLGTLSILALALLTLNSTASAQTEFRFDHDDSSAPIEGTWIVRNERINQGFTFTAVASFTAGGVWLAAGSIDPQNSTLYGSWKRTGSNRYDSTSFFFAFDPAGKAVAMIKVVQKFQLESQNKLTGDGVGFACDLEGLNCVSVPEVTIRITGRRVVSEKFF